MPALTKFYGLRPEDFDRMTLREVSEYRTQMAIHKANNPTEQR